MELAESPPIPPICFAQPYSKAAKLICGINKLNIKKEKTTTKLFINFFDIYLL